MSLIYIGDLSVCDAYQLLNEDMSARLIDVRTKAETIFVGAPHLSNLPNGNDVLDKYCQIEWQLFPSMQKNAKFIAELDTQLNLWAEYDNVQKQDRNLLFLCRSGVRSAYAADIATQMGCNKSYNIAYGFEGDVNEDGHRAKLSGWKFQGLPWSQ